MSKKDYYVYEVVVDGVVRYIGMGKGGRVKHSTSGKSTCVELNRDYFAGCAFAVSKVIIGVTEATALKEESRLIRSYGLSQLYNKNIPKPKEDLKGFIRYPSILFTVKYFKNRLTDETIQVSDWQKVFYSELRFSFLVEGGSLVSQKDMASQFQVTEKHIQKTIKALKASGILEVVKQGKSNKYTVHDLDKVTLIDHEDNYLN